MATAISIGSTSMDPVVVTTVTQNKAKPTAAKKLNRIREVRMNQGISLRTAARHLRMEMREVRAQEEESADLKLSDLYRWQQALDVPVAELLSDSSDPLSRPVLERAQLIKIMKTVQAILEQARTPGLQRLGTMLSEQLVEIMPELEGVSAWHSVGQRRSLEEFGRAVEQPVTLALFTE